jgi:hypothetical protein
MVKDLVNPRTPLGKKREGMRLPFLFS